VIVKDGKMWAFNGKKFYKADLTDEAIYDSLALEAKKIIDAKIKGVE
jgi:hypothetical protein